MESLYFDGLSFAVDGSQAALFFNGGVSYAVGAVIPVCSPAGSGPNTGSGSGSGSSAAAHARPDTFVLEGPVWPNKTITWAFKI